MSFIKQKDLESHMEVVNFQRILRFYTVFFPDPKFDIPILDGFSKNK